MTLGPVPDGTGDSGPWAPDRGTLWVTKEAVMIAAMLARREMTRFLKAFGHKDFDAMAGSWAPDVVMEFAHHYADIELPARPGSREGGPCHE